MSLLHSTLMICSSGKTLIAAAGEPRFISVMEGEFLLRTIFIDRDGFVHYAATSHSFFFASSLPRDVKIFKCQISFSRSFALRFGRIEIQLLLSSTFSFQGFSKDRCTANRSNRSHGRQLLECWVRTI